MVRPHLSKIASSESVLILRNAEKSPSVDSGRQSGGSSPRHSPQEDEMHHEEDNGEDLHGPGQGKHPQTQCDRCSD